MLVLKLISALMVNAGTQTEIIFVIVILGIETQETEKSVMVSTLFC